MLDIQLLRSDLDTVCQRLKTRGFDLDTQQFTRIETLRREKQTAMQELQAKRNATSKQIGILKKQGQDTTAIMAEVAHLGDELAKLEKENNELQNQLDNILLSIPNLPHSSVPVGKDETENVEVRKVGTPKSYDFEIKDHIDLGKPLGLDTDAGAALAGARFTVMKGAIARLHRALAQMMLDMHTTQHGYTEHYTPYIVNPEILYGTGQLRNLPKICIVWCVAAKRMIRNSI